VLGVVLPAVTTICPGCGGILQTDELCLTCLISPGPRCPSSSLVFYSLC
jgi:hypothetical protein